MYYVIGTSMSSLYIERLLTLINVLAQFREEQFQLRDPASYESHCQRLEGPLAQSDSVTYGINYRSPLNTIPFYHVANSQLPQDIMHVLLEGVLPMETKLMLRALISEKKFFSLDLLNERIMSFSYGKAEARNKPPKPLDMDHLLSRGSKLPLSGEYLRFY